MLWTLTCTFRVSTYMLHAQSAHLLSRATDPGTLDCTASPNGLLSLALRTTLWRPYLTQTAPTPPLHTPKKHAVGPETHQNLTPRPHHFRSAHVHAPPRAVWHQFSILVHLATSAVHLLPLRHLPPNMPASCVLDDKRLGYARQRCRRPHPHTPPWPPATPLSFGGLS